MGSGLRKTSGDEGSLMLDKTRIVKTPVKARQGFFDRPVLAVLLISLALVVALSAMIYGGFFGASG
jgi:hypothetical protein